MKLYIQKNKLGYYRVVREDGLFLTIAGEVSETQRFFEDLDTTEFALEEYKKREEHFEKQNAWETIKSLPSE